MASSRPDTLVRLDLNNPVFQDNLLGLQKAERHAALDTLKKIRQLTWGQLYRDNGMKWEKSAASNRPLGLTRFIPCELPSPGAAPPTEMGISFVF